jgi:NitT/TauT family transport system permease protein
MSERLLNWLSPILTFVVFIGLWHWVAAAEMVPAYLIPAPAAVGRAIVTVYREGTIWPHLFATGSEMLLGFAAGSAVAMVTAAIVAEFRAVERCIYPYIVALQSMPKVALAPLLIVWFGFGLASKIVLVALICFFPVFVNVLTGLRATRPDLIDLYRAFGSSRWRIFWDVRLPSAAGAIFAGLQVALVMALLGAVVGEFVAAQEGLGSLIQASSLNFEVPVMFACILTLAAMGAIANAIVRFVQRRVVFWEGAGGRGGTVVKGEG